MAMSMALRRLARGPPRSLGARLLAADAKPPSYLAHQARNHRPLSKAELLSPAFGAGSPIVGSSAGLRAELEMRKSEVCAGVQVR